MELPTGNFIEVPEMTDDDVSDMARIIFSKRDLTITTEIVSLLRDQLPSRTPFHVSILLIMLTEMSISLDKQPALIKHTTSELVNDLFQYLEDRFLATCVQKISSYMVCSRYGMTDSEIMNLLATDSDLIRSVQPHKQSLVVGAPSCVWLYMKDILKPLLLERTSHGFLVYRWKSVISDIIKTRYHSLVSGCEKRLLAYYNGPKITSKKNASPEVSKAAYVRTQELKYERSFNGRKLDELPCLMLGQDQVNEVAKKLLSFSWLSAKLCASGVMAACDDLDLCICKLKDGTQKSSAIFIRNLLQGLAYSFTEDPSQLSAQLHLRHKSNNITIPEGLPEIKDLFKNCKAHTGPILLPASNGLNILQLTYEPVKDGSHVFSGFFHLRNEPDHLISVAPERGVLHVWNTYTGQVVRTITGLQQPKDAKMCDLYKAVVLCNRELKIYDLDSGEYVCSLKGVLNIRMPFFGVHDKEHTISMARNRMYVNMMSNTTGEMVTTFKVGEDRFMDSMLTSENGEKCVCGDAVQKPFPLLVWDLLKRKLIYDLRIQGHEFITKVSAIAKDGHYVACACKVGIPYIHSDII